MTIFTHLTRRTSELGHRPAVVFRDAGSGERTELSYATLHNWVSKTANLLQEDFDLGLGSEVGVDLPLHWTAPVLCLAAWAVGAAVTVDGRGEVRVGHEVDLAPDGPVDVDVLIGSGMGGRPIAEDTGRAATVIDILGQPDDFVDDPGDEGAWAIGGRTQATLLAEPSAAERILHAGDRVTEETAFLIARTLPAGCSLVLARGYDVTGLSKVTQEEQVP